jgi:hypothetical protein
MVFAWHDFAEQNGNKLNGLNFSFYPFFFLVFCYIIFLGLGKGTWVAL